MSASGATATRPARHRHGGGGGPADSTAKTEEGDPTSDRAVLVVGAGGHGEVALDALIRSGRRVAGVLDADRTRHGQELLGVRVLGGDEAAEAIGPDEADIVVAVVGFGRGSPRFRMAEHWRSLGYRVVGFVHPTAVIAAAAELDASVQVLAGAIINPGGKLGRDVIVNTGAIVEHDARIGDGVHIAPGAALGGQVTLGARAQIGIHATILNGITVGEGAVVGAGAVVVHDVEPHTLVVGVPARAVKHYPPDAD